MPSHDEEPAGSFFVGPHENVWVAHCDGGAWPNPGSMAIGVVLVSPDGEIQAVSQRLPGTGCNNEAEWRAVVAAFRLALEQGATALRLHTDSTQVRDHLASAPLSALPAALQPWVDEARALSAELATYSVRWVPRHRNGQADALARKALGLTPKPTLAPHPRSKRRR